MATGTNHFKLGLFVLGGIALALVFMVTLGARTWNAESVRYVTYFDESVQGLEVGSPVKFRGVAVGRVAEIGIAPDQRHVQVTSELTVPDLRRLNLGGSGERALAVHSDLRAQLAQTGITGVKFILIDYFEAADQPPPELPFAAAGNHIPAAPSSLARLESSVLSTADRFPEITDELRTMLSQLNAIGAEVGRARLPEQAGQALGEATLAMRALSSELEALNAAGLSRSVRQSLAAFDATSGRLGALIDRLEREDGVLASSEQTLALLGEVARGSGSLGPELELTLRELRGAVRSIRRFTDALERDPDMLVKGRAR